MDEGAGAVYMTPFYYQLETARNRKNLKYLAEEAVFMDIEEIARKYCMRELKPIAKKYGIGTRCVKKIDIIKAFPQEALAELTGEQQ